MVTDVQSTLGMIGGNLSKGLGTAGMFALYIMLIVVLFGIVGALLWFYFNKKSYKIRVHILKPIGGTGKFHWDSGFRAKQFFDKKRKEVRFRIYKGAKMGLQYNNEAIAQEYFVRQVINGKNIPHVFLSPNKEGWLQPVMMDLDAARGMVATVQNADLSYYQTELELMDSMFGNKSFMEKYYLLILVILMIVVCIIQWYSAAQIHKAAVINLQAVQLLTDTGLKMAQMLGTANATQVFPIG